MRGSPEQVIEKKQDECADDGADKSRPLADMIPTDRLSQIGRQERTRDAEQGGYDQSAWITARHQKFGNPARAKADDDCPQNVHGWIL